MAIANLNGHGEGLLHELEALIVLARGPVMRSVEAVAEILAWTVHDATEAISTLEKRGLAEVFEDGDDVFVCLSCLAQHRMGVRIREDADGAWHWGAADSRDFQRKLTGDDYRRMHHHAAFIDSIPDPHPSVNCVQAEEQADRYERLKAGVTPHARNGQHRRALEVDPGFGVIVHTGCQPWRFMDRGRFWPIREGELKAEEAPPICPACAGAVKHGRHCCVCEWEHTPNPEKRMKAERKGRRVKARV